MPGRCRSPSGALVARLVCRNVESAVRFTDSPLRQARMTENDKLGREQGLGL